MPKHVIKSAIQAGLLPALKNLQAFAIRVVDFDAWLWERQQLSLTGAARKLGLPISLLRVAIKSGELPETRGRTILLQRRDIDEWQRKRAERDDPDWITVSQACQRFEVSTAQIDGAIASGHLEKRTDPVRLHLPQLEAHHRQHWLKGRSEAAHKR